MTPLTLFDPPHNGTHTSAAAAASIRARVPTDESLILAHLRAYGPATCDALEAALGLRHQTCSARLRGLAQRGTIVTTGTTAPTRSGRAAVVWRVA